MSGIEEQAAHLLAPQATKIAAIAVTSTSAGTDLSAANQLGSDINKGRFVTFMADGGDIYVAFGSSDPAAIVAATTTAGSAERCWLLKDGVPQDFVLNGLTYVEAITATTATLRCYVSSRLPHAEA
jgi:alkylation response protein AidB-like acyl-CoA dehydrogenase